MKAVLYAGAKKEWAAALGGTAWPLLPVANRPLIDHWLETCAEIGIPEVQIILGDDAAQIERYVGEGKRWGVGIQYSFARLHEQPLDYLRLDPGGWKHGLLFLADSVFLRRLETFSISSFGTEGFGCFRHAGQPVFIFCRDGAAVRSFLEQPWARVANEGCERWQIEPFMIETVMDYFNLNMRMVAGEFPRYVTAGYSDADGSSIGYNVRTPPSTRLKSPILIGNDCRFGPLSTIGPNAVVGDHVIVDSNSELSNCLILQDTYIGRNLDIDRKIVAGKRVISPVDGTAVEINDSWIVARNLPDRTTADAVRYFILWWLALGIALLQTVPFCLLYPLIWAVRQGGYRREVFHHPKFGYVRLPVFSSRRPQRSFLVSLFRAGTLDRFPWLLLALRGRLFVSGQPPMRHPEDDEIIRQLTLYVPAVFTYADYNQDSDKLVDSLWYAHIRSLFEDVKIVIKTLLHRFFRAGR